MRWKILLSIIFIAYLILLSKIYFITIKEHTYYRELSQNNITKIIKIKPSRGIIYDKNSIPIAYNELRFSILIKPHLKNKELNETLNYIYKVLKYNKKEMKKEYKSQNSYYNHDFILVKNYIKYKELLPYITYLSLNKDLQIEPSYLRIYPLKNSVSNILGYVSKASLEDMQKNVKIKTTKMVGKTGLEKYYDDILQGKIGFDVVKVNSTNKILKEIKKESPKTSNIQLNIDTKLQTMIYNLLKKEKKKGVVIVMGIDGKVLAMVSYPSYDNNLFVKGISVKEWNKILHNLFNPFMNKAINGKYPAGSVVKPIEALIALNAKIISPYTKIFCPGFLEISGRKFRDWKKDGHGYVNVIKSIKRSVDVYYYKIGLKLGIDYLSKELKRFGFGVKTGIDLSNESQGTIPNKEWKRKKYHTPWYIGETLNSVIGQGFVLVTPLQVAVNTALIASGKLPTPQVVFKINGKQVKPIIKNVFTKNEKKQLKYIRKGMWEVCNSSGGTATNHLYTKIKIAGKTGTAQTFSIPQEVKKRKRESELAYFRRSHAWITTYGPYKNPKYVVTVLIEHGGHGGQSAGGIVSEIYNYLLKNGYIKK